MVIRFGVERSFWLSDESRYTHDHANPRRLPREGNAFYGRFHQYNGTNTAMNSAR